MINKSEVMIYNTICAIKTFPFSSFAINHPTFTIQFVLLKLGYFLGFVPICIYLQYNLCY